ncbi:hypothetical protein Tcan_00253 [Toxocara canis]|uniref:Uncharacterized protein n=1 Tax=Toxocara canis TaxID=6265 RepID=A0A0B2UWX9_TOXCA|nr:hypothetical protein Tcan_00253 [Toxocara canis]
MHICHLNCYPRKDVSHGRRSATANNPCLWTDRRPIQSRRSTKCQRCNQTKSAMQQNKKPKLRYKNSFWKKALNIDDKQLAYLPLVKKVYFIQEPKAFTKMNKSKYYEIDAILVTELRIYHFS